MSNERKVVIKSESSDVDSLDDVVTIEMSDNPEDIDILEVDASLSDEEYKSVEDLDDSEQIWDGGPTAGQIKQWKEQYGEVYVTSITYDKHIVWRVLNRVEYKHIVKKMEQLMQSGQLSSAEANMWNEETISEMCILFPAYDRKQATGMMAGVPSLIAQEVLEASGFVALEVRQL